MVDILQHELVPKHKKLTKKEEEKVLKKYNASKEKIPKILSTDPAIKEIEAQPGDIIKIIRNSETAGKVVYYRVVIQG